MANLIAPSYLTTWSLCPWDGPTLQVSCATNCPNTSLTASPSVKVWPAPRWCTLSDNGMLGCRSFHWGTGSKSCQSTRFEREHPLMPLPHKSLLSEVRAEATNLTKKHRGKDSTTPASSVGVGHPWTCHAFPCYFWLGSTFGTYSCARIQIEEVFVRLQIVYRNNTAYFMWCLLSCGLGRSSISTGYEVGRLHVAGTYLKFKKQTKIDKYSYGSRESVSI